MVGVRHGPSLGARRVLHPAATPSSAISGGGSSDAECEDEETFKDILRSDY